MDLQTRNLANNEKPTVYLKCRLALLPISPETPAAAAEEELVAACGGREGPLPDQAAAPATPTATAHFDIAVVVDGDDVGLGVDVGVGVQQVGDGGEHVLEGDLQD